MNRLKRSAALLLAALTVLSMSGMTAFAEAGLPEPMAAAENGEPDVDGVPEQNRRRANLPPWVRRPRKMKMTGSTPRTEQRMMPSQQRIRIW